MAHHHDHDHHHGEDHTHNELEETLELTATRLGRVKLLGAAIGNGVLMLASAKVAHSSGADASLIEAAHDFGDTGYYAAPLIASLLYGLHSNKAARWMRGTAYAATSLAVAGVCNSIYGVVTEGFQKPEVSSGFWQLGFAAANYAIAAALGIKPGRSVVDKAALRHAKNDARTSMVAAGANFAGAVFAPFNLVGSMAVGVMTVRTERKTIREANLELSGEGNVCA